jgi:flagellar hook-length control protein FliK
MPGATDGTAAAASSANGNAKATDTTKGAATTATATTAGDASTTNPTFSAMVDAAAQTGGKTKAPAQAKTAAVATTDANAKTDQAATTAQAAQPIQTDATQQAAAMAKQDGSLVVADPTKSKGDGTAAPAVHERSGASTNAQGTLSAADADVQAANALQPQLATQQTTAPLVAANLTATAATSAAVPLSGLAVEIAGSALNGKSRFEIRLDPAELGRIDVRIDVDRSGQITSHLRVEKPETLSMLQQTAPQLQQALNDAGLKTGSGGLQFSLRDHTSSGQNGNNDQSNGNAQRLVISDEDATPAATAGRSYGRMLSASGGIDIRV